MRHLNIIKTAILSSILLAITTGCNDNKEDNHAPTVTIKIDSDVVNIGETVNLSATATDVDGDNLTYLWSMKSKPNNTHATLSSSTTKTTSFKADIDGKYVLTFKANDGVSDSDVKEVTIQVVELEGDPVLLIKEDCSSQDLSKLKIIQDGSNWTIVEDRSLLFAFKDKDEAERSLEIMKYYKMDKHCFVGRPHPSLVYFLAEDKAPQGTMVDEDCVGFTLANLQVKKINNSYKIVDRAHWIFDFEDKRDEANDALSLIKKYGFTQSCYVGRPDPDFSYLRKGSNTPLASDKIVGQWNYSKSLTHKNNSNLTTTNKDEIARFIKIFFTSESGELVTLSYFADGKISLSDGVDEIVSDSKWKFENNTFFILDKDGKKDTIGVEGDSIYSFMKSSSTGRKIKIYFNRI